MASANANPQRKSAWLSSGYRRIVNQLTHLHRLQTGLLHLLLQHTSASLTLNENCDPTVRADMEQHFLRQVPENAPYQHDYEGPDDMPAHIKSSLLGAS